MIYSRCCGDLVCILRPGVPYHAGGCETAREVIGFSESAVERG